MKDGTPQPQFDFLPQILIRASTHPIAWASQLGATSTQSRLSGLLESTGELVEIRMALDAVLFELIPAQPDARRAGLLTIKRKIRSSFEALSEAEAEAVQEAGAERTGALVSKWQSAAVARARLELEARSELAAETARAREKLRAVLLEPLVQEGIYLSSEKLHEALIRYLRTPVDGSRLQKWQRQFERSALEHLARACGKTTPRGVLTGVGVARWRNDQAAAISMVAPVAGAAPIASRRTRLSLPIAREIARGLSPDHWGDVVPRPNPTVELGDGRIRFWRYDFDARAQQLFELPRNEILSAFLKHAEPRALSAMRLIAEVAAECGRPEPELQVFYKKLTGVGVLLGALEIPFERPDGLEYLIEWLELLPEERRGPSALSKFRALKELLQKADDLSLTWPERLSLYESARERVRELLPPDSRFRDAGASSLFIVDTLVNTGEVTLGAPVLEAARRALAAGHALTAASNAVFEPEIAAGRYLANIEGLEGGAMRLSRLVGATLKARETQTAGPAESPRPAAPSFSQIFGAWLDELERDGRCHEASLDDADLWRRLTGGGAATELGVHQLGFRLIRRGDRVELVAEGMHNNFVADLGRHLSLLPSEEWRRELNAYYDWLRRARGADAAWADVVAMNFTKTDSAYWRPAFHPYVIELPWIRSARAAGERIPLGELWVQRDGRGASLVWRPEGGAARAVRPDFSSLFPPAQPLEIFMRLLGFSVSAALSYWIKPELSARAHLPRMKIADSTVQRESWSFGRDELRSLFHGDDFDTFRAWAAFRAENGLPRHLFVLDDDDKPYWVDTLNPFALESFGHKLATSKRARITLREMRPSPEDDSGVPYAIQFLAAARHGRGS